MFLAPILWAVLFISSENFSTEPDTSQARAVAASLPELSIIAYRRSSIVIFSPLARYTLDPSMPTAASFTVISLSGCEFSMAEIAVIILVVLAIGMRLSAFLLYITLPLEFSMTIAD